MSYHHYNRLLAHWQPKLKPEGIALAYGSKKRYESLSSGAVAVAQFVSSHLNNETNCYAISQKTIEAKLGLTKGTIVKALKDLVAWGIFTRERVHKEKPYIYFLAIRCPENCEHLETHNTVSELATLSKKQATPLTKKQGSYSPKKQATGGLENRQLIDINKQTNKEMNRARSSCFSCLGEFETLSNGNREVIHSHDCQQLKQIMSSQGWNITRGQIGLAWDSLDIRDQQIANYLSLAKGKERKAKRDQEELAEELNREDRFGRMIAGIEFDNKVRFNPEFRQWLWIVYNQRGRELPVTHEQRAVNYARLGWHLKPEGDWREGALIHRDSFIESDQDNTDRDLLDRISFTEIGNSND